MTTYAHRRLHARLTDLPVERWSREELEYVAARWQARNLKIRAIQAGKTVPQDVRDRIAEGITRYYERRRR